MSDHVLDNPIWASLAGPHAHLAQIVGRAARYPADISPFVGVRSEPTDGPGTDPGEAAWADVATLLGPGADFAISRPIRPPAGWDVHLDVEGVQLIATSDLQTAPDPEAIELGPADQPEMLDLVARNRPGPFERRTMDLGRYVGIRRDGELVAMAGERFHPPGHVEISAVCTDAAYRGQGLASRLVRAIGHGIRDRGETPFLHAAAGNTNAIRLYLAMGFELRMRTRFLGIRTPAGIPVAG